MRGDVIGLVAQEELAILEADAGDSQPMTVGMLEILYPDGSKPFRARSPEPTRIALRRPPSRRLPARVVDLGHGLTLASEDELGVLASTVVDHGLGDPVQDHVSIQTVLHVAPWND